MPFSKPLPRWDKIGTEPPENLKTNGWQAQQKPPADYFNWLQYTAYQALKELQEKAMHIDDVSPVADASTTQKGIVQLTTSTTSTSTTLAPTASALKAVKDAIPALNNTVTSTSTTLAATANAVKVVNDLAASKYSKPGAGIPKTDLTNDVQASLNKADSATQSVPEASTSQKGVVQLSNSISSTSTDQAATSNAVKSVNDALTTHKNDKSNPHGVTKAQVGLGSVDNVKQEPYQFLESNAKTKNDPPTSYKLGVSYLTVGGTGNAWGIVNDSDTTYYGIFTFKYDNSGGHQSYQIAYKVGVNVPESYIRKSVDASNWGVWSKQVTNADLTAHTSRTDNPHGVTKAQVGLSLVDNVKQEPYQFLGNDIKAMSDLPETYRLGITIMTGSKNNKGWAIPGVNDAVGNTVVIVTVKANPTAHVVVQYAINQDGSVQKMGFRVANPSNGTWGNWSAIATSNEVGPLSSLLTVNKSNTVSAINELVTNFNNAKTAVANATTAKGVPASPTDTFAVLAGKIGQINTGKKWASGEGLSYTYASARNLPFRPSIVLIRQGNTSENPWTSTPWWDHYYCEFLTMNSGQFNLSGQTWIHSNILTVYNDGFYVNLNDSNTVERPYKWIAIE